VHTLGFVCVLCVCWPLPNVWKVQRAHLCPGQKMKGVPHKRDKGAEVNHTLVAFEEVPSTYPGHDVLSQSRLFIYTHRAVYLHRAVPKSRPDTHSLAGVTQLEQPRKGRTRNTRRGLLLLVSVPEFVFRPLLSGPRLDLLQQSNKNNESTAVSAYWCF